MREDAEKTGMDAEKARLSDIVYPLLLWFLRFDRAETVSGGSMQGRRACITEPIESVHPDEASERMPGSQSRRAVNTAAR